MADEVWVCTIFGNSDYYADPLRVKVAAEKAQQTIATARENFRGVVFQPEAFPKTIVYTDAEKPVATLPDIFVAGDYIGVSEAAADAIRTDDLGDCSLFPVEAFQADETTHVSGQYFLINYGNAKPEAFLPEQSTGLRADPFRKGVWRARQTMKNGNLVVPAAAVDDLGIWVDPRLEDAFFLSGKIVKALRRIGNFSKLQLRKCSIV